MELSWFAAGIISATNMMHTALRKIERNAVCGIHSPLVLFIANASNHEIWRGECLEKTSDVYQREIHTMEAVFPARKYLLLARRE